MEPDMTEYDQFDEIELPLDTRNQGAETGSYLLVSLESSGPSSANSDDTNCENDYVFLPRFAPQQAVNRLNNAVKQKLLTQVAEPEKLQKPEYFSTGQPQLQATSVVRRGDSKLSFEQANDAVQYHSAQPAIHPLMAINSNSGNPFFHLQQVSPDGSQQATPTTNWLKQQILESSKPIGLLDTSANNSSNPNQLADLMHQIVTKSDSIYIAIPCELCLESVVCLPSDLTQWLNHMYRQHNCKVCPICSRLVGLGPRRDIDIMKNHVLGHIDENWLERKSTKVSFTYGLQQHWFSGVRCSIKETSRSHGLFRN